MRYLIFAAAFWACGQADSDERAQAPVLQLNTLPLACVPPDSVRAGDSYVWTSKRKTEISGTIIGEEITVTASDSSWHGSWVYFTNGEQVEPPRPLSVRFDPTTKVLAFADRRDTTLQFRGQVMCDSLVGSLGQQRIGFERAVFHRRKRAA